MKNILLLTMMVVILFSLMACSGDAVTTSMTSATTSSTTHETVTEVQEPDEEEFLETALYAITGLQILDIKIIDNDVTISYAQITDDSEAVLLQRWLDLAAATLSFVEEPRDIIILPVVEGSPVAKVNVEAGNVALFMTGEISLQETLATIKIEEAA